jgi:hypothetical protein
MSDSVSHIGDRNIDGYHKLQKIKLPASLTTLGEYNFNGCETLATLELPESLENIPSWFLYNNRGVAKLKIPRSVKTISTSYAFNGCAIRQLIIEPSLPVTFGSIDYYCAEIIYLCDAVPSSFNPPSYYCDVYVPDDLYDGFVSIVIASDKRARIRKHSEYPGVLPT